MLKLDDPSDDDNSSTKGHSFSIGNLNPKASVPKASVPRIHTNDIPTLTNWSHKGFATFIIL